MPRLERVKESVGGPTLAVLRASDGPCQRLANSRHESPNPATAATSAPPAMIHPVAVMTPTTSAATPPAVQTSQPLALSSRVAVRPSVMAAVNTVRGEAVHEHGRWFEPWPVRATEGDVLVEVARRYSYGE